MIGYLTWTSQSRKRHEHEFHELVECYEGGKEFFKYS